MYCEYCGRKSPCRVHKNDERDCSAFQEESTGYVLVKYYGKDHWNNYKFFQKGKFVDYHGHWMDDPIEATVFGVAYFDRAVSDIQLICHPNYNYKFVPVNVRSTREVNWKRTYIAQSNTND